MKEKNILTMKGKINGLIHDCCFKHIFEVLSEIYPNISKVIENVCYK